jgi:hypothetical protein
MRIEGERLGGGVDEQQNRFGDMFEGALGSGVRQGRSLASDREPDSPILSCLLEGEAEVG